MTIDIETDDEVFRFADRYLAAQTWAIVAALTGRHAELRASAVVNEDGTPLLIVHDDADLVRVQFDLLAWILFGVDGDQHLYWDEVFGHQLSWTVQRIESASGLEQTEGPLTARAATYRAIAAVLALGVDDPRGWQVRPVLIGPEAERDDEVLAAFAGSAEIVDAIERDIEAQLDVAGAVLFFEPLWALWHDGSPALLLDSTRGTATTTHWSTIDLLGDDAPASFGGTAAALHAAIREVTGAPVTQEDLGLDDGWSLEDFSQAVRGFLDRRSTPENAPIEASSWLRTAAAVADLVVAGASFGRVVAHLELHPRVVAPLWEALDARADATPHTTPGDDETQLCPIHPRHQVAQAWALASGVARRVGGAQVVVGGASLPRIVAEDGRPLVTVGTDAITVADSPEPLTWWDVFAAPFADTVVETITKRLDVALAPDAAYAAHRWIARALATEVGADEPLSVVELRHPTAGTAWALCRRDGVLAVVDKSAVLVGTAAYRLSGGPTAETRADMHAAVDKAPLTSATLWDGGGLHVTAARGEFGTLAIHAQDLSGGWAAEYEYYVDIEDEDALVSALGGEPGSDPFRLLEARGPEIVWTGEAAWMRAHGVPHSVFVESDGGSTSTGAPLAPTTTYVVQVSERVGLLHTFAIHELPGAPARSCRTIFQWLAGRWKQSTQAALDHAADDDFSIIEVASETKLRDLNPAAAQTPLPVLTGNPFAQVALATAIAHEAHAGQLDKLGVAYIGHPQAVASAFDPETQPVECAAAWLHDVLEDTAVDADELRARGVQQPVVHVVELLTRRDDVPDDAYYARIAADPVARAVKLADIAHNLHPSRVAALAPAVRDRLARKYDKALLALGVRDLEGASV